MKKSWKRVLLAALAVCAVLSGLVSCKKQEAKGEHKATVSIDCSKIWAHEADLNADNADYVPKDGVVLGKPRSFLTARSRPMTSYRPCARSARSRWTPRIPPMASM